MKKIFWALVIILVAIQFFQPKKNSSNDKSKAIGTLYPTSTSVQNILQKACNDCHSNNTQYPWYANVQPLAWWLNHHINEGKEEINFDEFANYKLRKQYHKLEEVTEMIKEDEMPLKSYTLIHKEAKLTAEEKNTLTQWATAIMDTMKAKYPIDSLMKKKQ